MIRPTECFCMCNPRIRIRIRPRVLIDITKRDTSCNVFGIDLSFPVAIAPTAMLKMANPCGERAVARGKLRPHSLWAIHNFDDCPTNHVKHFQNPCAAAGAMNTIYTMSTLSTSSIEEVAEVAPNTNKWFQLYIYKDRRLAQNIIRRAEKAGYKALVLTVDAAVFGNRRADIRNKFTMPPNLQ